MANIRLIIGCLVFLSVGCANSQNKSDSKNFLIGKWKFVKYFDWQATEFGNKEIQSIKKDTLIIEPNKIYFLRSKFIEPSNYSKILFVNFFDGRDKKPNVMEDRALAIKYSKEQLGTFKRIEVNGDPYNCLNTLYLHQDTLILNYCGGITLFMLKLKVLCKS